MSLVPEPGVRGFVAVTGAAGSVGPHLAAALAARGWSVALMTRPGSEATAMERSAALVGPGTTLEAVGVDLTDEAAASAALTGLAGRLGPCAALFCVAGGFASRPAHEATLADLAQMLDRNLVTAVNATRAVLPGMLERGRGFVLGVSAGAATSPAPGRTAYAAAKGAVSAYFRSLAAEVSGTGVHAGLLTPIGTIDTPANRNAMPAVDRSKWIRVEAVVDAALYLSSTSGVRELELHGG